MMAFMTFFKRLLQRIQPHNRSTPHAALPPEVEAQIHHIAAEQQEKPEILLNHFLTTAIRSQDLKWQQWETLTPREKCVAALGCLGYTNNQIAQRLTISQNTVKTHVRNVLRKFKLHSKDELRQYLNEWDFSDFE